MRGGPSLPGSWSRPYEWDTDLVRIWSFAKGHGTGNDFVILLDRHTMSDPSADEVVWLCDRHRSVGGDGLLRVVRAREIDGWDGDPDLWFMDYRNADGSLAQMCGNGARVFARYLAEQDLVSGPVFDIGTRDGVKHIEITSRDQIRVGMGTVHVSATVPVTVTGQEFAATAAQVGTTHAVVQVDDLAGLDLSRAPEVRAADFPDGVNVEFVVSEQDRIRMRVHERGVGETLSCGTGTVAAAAVLGREHPDSHRRLVEVPGGLVEVELGPLTADGREAWLTGPAEITVHGKIHLPD